MTKLQMLINQYNEITAMDKGTARTIARFQFNQDLKAAGYTLADVKTPEVKEKVAETIITVPVHYNFYDTDWSRSIEFTISTRLEDKINNLKLVMGKNSEYTKEQLSAQRHKLYRKAYWNGLNTRHEDALCKKYNHIIFDVALEPTQSGMTFSDPTIPNFLLKYIFYNLQQVRVSIHNTINDITVELDKVEGDYAEVGFLGGDNTAVGYKTNAEFILMMKEAILATLILPEYTPNYQGTEEFDISNDPRLYTYIYNDIISPSLTVESSIYRHNKDKETGEELPLSNYLNTYPRFVYTEQDIEMAQQYANWIELDDPEQKSFRRDVITQLCDDKDTLLHLYKTNKLTAIQFWTEYEQLTSLTSYDEVEYKVTDDNDPVVNQAIANESEEV